jgi:cytochrome c-type biogenesis protein CcmH
MRWRELLLALALAAASALAHATDAQPTDRDSVAAARAVKLSEKLRCLVCQNQSIADSNADLAQDLRRQIREQITAGKTDDEIVAYMVARYGDFVLYEPPLKTTTVLLWAGPALLVLGGFVGLARFLAVRRATAAAPALSPEERQRAQRLLTGGSEDRSS